MKDFDPNILKQLTKPGAGSHKGQNGKLLVVGGSHLFHAASLWSLTVASRILDMVFYSSVVENNEIVKELKKEFRNGIVIPRGNLEEYVQEADAILIGPGMVRLDTEILDNDAVTALPDIEQLSHEGLQTYHLTKLLIDKYPHKKWIIDAGALQMMRKEWLHKVSGNAIITPHPKEFRRLFGEEATDESIARVASEYSIVVVVKGEKDIVCSKETCVTVSGGNAGMTKGGTGDVLAGLIAALAATNELFVAAQAGSYINKKAGDSLYKKMGYYFNASDLANEIPVVMKELLLKAK